MSVQTVHAYGEVTNVEHIHVDNWQLTLLVSQARSSFPRGIK